MGNGVTDLSRVLLERDLRAKSSVARFGLLVTGVEDVQITLPCAPLPRPAAIGAPAMCNHAGTGREPQKRLFAPGFDSTCARCGAVTED